MSVYNPNVYAARLSRGQVDRDASLYPRYLRGRHQQRLTWKKWADALRDAANEAYDTTKEEAGGYFKYFCLYLVVVVAAWVGEYFRMRTFGYKFTRRSPKNTYP